MGEPERDWNLPCNEDSDNLRARAKRTRKRGVVEERETGLILKIFFRVEEIIIIL